MDRLENFMDLVRARRSCRNYSERPVEREVLEKCCEALRLAPSACNRQPWRVTVVQDAGLRNELAEHGLLPGIPMPWLKKAPVILCLSIERNVLAHRVATWFSRVDYPYLDLGIAGEQLVLAAEAAGLKSCWIGWIRPNRIRKILALPWSFKITALLSLGYPAEAFVPAETKRRDLSEIIDFK